MAFTAFPDVGRACVDFDLNTVNVSICINFKKAGATPTDFQLIADSIGTEYAAVLMPQMSNDLIQGETTVYDMATETSPVYTSINGSGTVGGAPQDSTPNNATFLISHRTLTRGRSGRGRTYAPGLSETNVVDGQISTGRVASLLTEWLTFIINVESTTSANFVIAQRFSGGVQLVTGITHSVTTEIVPRRVASQRRRTLG